MIMTTTPTVSSPTATSAGRRLFWLGITLPVLGIVFMFVQFSALQIIDVTPWYVPVSATLGVLFLLFSRLQRRSIPRVVALSFVTVLAVLEWVFFGTMLKLPTYQGPAEVGRMIPAFQTTLANGSSFTEKNLQEGSSSVFVFFRGRW